MKKMILVIAGCLGISGVVCEYANGMQRTQECSVSYGGEPVKIEKTRWEHLNVAPKSKDKINKVLSSGLDALDSKETMLSVIKMLTMLDAECSNYAWMVFVDTYPNSCDERQRRIGDIIAMCAQHQALNIPIPLDLQGWYSEN